MATGTTPLTAGALLERCRQGTVAADLGAGLALLALVAWALTRLVPLPNAAMVQMLCVYSAIALLVLRHFGRAARRSRFGAANRITLLRALIAAVYVGLVFHADAVIDHGWWLVAGAVLALLLDGLDGWAARRGGGTSAFGSAFDMEIDAFFILVLAALVLAFGKAGPWVLWLGSLRYLFLLGGRVAPALRAPLPPSLRRRVVCLVQCVVLLACLAPVVSPALAAPMLLLALALLGHSFAVDTLWLLRRPHCPAPLHNGRPRC